MNQIPVLNFQDFIAADGDQLTTDSRKVAAVHGKRHDNVVRLIRHRIAEAGAWGLLNFEEGVYFDPGNQKNHPMFTMTKDGYQFLVGKMTGKKAVAHQIAFIEAFNAMAALIKNQREGLHYRQRPILGHRLHAHDQEPPVRRPRHVRCLGHVGSIQAEV